MTEDGFKITFLLIKNLGVDFYFILPYTLDNIYLYYFNDYFIVYVTIKIKSRFSYVINILNCSYTS